MDNNDREFENEISPLIDIVVPLNTTNGLLALKF